MTTPTLIALENGERSTTPDGTLTLLPHPPTYSPPSSQLSLSSARIKKYRLKRIVTLAALVSAIGVANFIVDNAYSKPNEFTNYPLLARCFLNLGIIMGGLFIFMHGCLTMDEPTYY